MVNINQINDLTQAAGSRTPAKQNAADAPDAFGSVLDSALQKADRSEEGTKTAGLGEIAAPGFELEPLPSIVTGKTDRLLGMLDNYASQLQNPDVSLRSIEPVLEEINQSAESLMEKAKFLGDEESSLKDIATQTAVTARTEYVKFQRGDYLG